MNAIASPIANTTARRLLIAALCFAGFAVLGRHVSQHPPEWLDLEGRGLRGEVPWLALFFTTLGYSYAIAAVFAFVFVLTKIAAGPLWVPIAILCSQLISQAVIALAKLPFHRIRPENALGNHLPDYSYPSGHASTSIVFYAALALFVATGRNIPTLPRFVTAAMLAICIFAIPWSRLALGAHYVTDVVGGLLFGIGWVALVVAIVRSEFTVEFVSKLRRHTIK